MKTLRMSSSSSQNHQILLLLLTAAEIYLLLLQMETFPILRKMPSRKCKSCKHNYKSAAPSVLLVIYTIKCMINSGLNVGHF